MFVWAWGINGCFSVIGAALVPIVATSFGLSAVLDRQRLRLSPGDPGLLRRAAAAAQRQDLSKRRRDRDASDAAIGPGSMLSGALSCCCKLRRSRRGFATPMPHAKTALAEFDNSPFPYRGDIPEKNMPFLDAVDGDRRGHTSPRGGVYWEDDLQRPPRAAVDPEGLRSEEAGADRRLLPRQHRHAHARRARPPAGAAPARGVRA